MIRNNFSGLAALLVMALSAGLAVGCAKSTSRASQKASLDVLREKLGKVPLSANLALRDSASSCDEARALSAFDARTPLDLAHAPELWDSCQDLYQCSETSFNALRAWFDGGDGFRLGFTDLKGANIPVLGNKVGGMYWAGSGNIYIDTQPKTTRKVCALLLHELVHRFDPAAQNANGTLATEFRAYWTQFTYQDELFLDRGDLGAYIRENAAKIDKEDAPDGQPASSDGVSQGIYTRMALHDAIVKVYKFSPDPSIIEDYPMLPREKQQAKQPKNKF